MITETTSDFIGKRYWLRDPVGQGAMGVVYRATDRLTGQSVALKRVHRSVKSLTSDLAEQPFESDERLALAREFQLLASLRHPNIISVLDYGFDDEHQPFFTMELLDHAQTIFSAGQGQPRDVQVGLLIQVLQALRYLHRRGILHRDLKPGNILVVQERVKLLDFGLSTMRRSEADEQPSTAGTLAYMAPEVLRGEPASETADLYSVGVIAYELFTGRRPFDAPSITQLIDQILTFSPDLSQIIGSGSVPMVVERLLDKDPTFRLADAFAAIRALSDSIGQPIPIETTGIRESFLQSAPLIGREAERSMLSGAFAQALNSHGSAWLISGESGVGKSRLIGELRALALVQGAVVLRGLAVSDGGSPYQVWCDPLRWLSLISKLDSAEASVLKPLVSDMERLIGGPVPDSPELDPQAAQDRLLTTLEKLFRRQTQPVVIILEDLHWAAESSVVVLARLSEIVAGLPVLIVGSYRDDERADLPQMLPRCAHLKLNRLDGPDIEALSVSMLGDAGRHAPVVALLQRETEGNVFFLIEAIRALAEETGQLDQIGTKTLPEHLFVGGMRLIVQRRLKRVPSADYPLLRLAAVLGRELDLAVLRRLAPDVDLERWLSACQDAAVLSVQSEQWQFAHAKLRDGVLLDLRPAERQALHRHVAEAISSVYPDTDSVQHVAALAYHYRKAAVWDQAFEFSLRAGDAATRLYSYAEARAHYGHAREALDQLDQLSSVPDSIPHESGERDAREPDSPDPHRKTEVERETDRRRIDINLKWINVSFAAENPIKLLTLLSDLETSAKRLTADQAATDADKLRLARIHFWIGRAHYYKGELRTAIGQFRQVLAEAKTLDDQEVLALPSSVIGRAQALQGYYTQALPGLQQAVRYFEKTGNWTEWPVTNSFVGLCLAANGDYQTGLAYAEQSLRRAQELRNLTAVVQSHVVLFFIAAFGGEVARMLAEALAILDSAEQSGDQVYLAQGYSARALAESRNGNHVAAMGSLAQSQAVIDSLGGRIGVSDISQAIQAEIVLNAGQPDEAIRLVENLLVGNVGPYAEGVARRVLGRAYAALPAPRWAEAEIALAAAVRIHESSGNILEAAHTQEVRGRLLPKDKDP